MEAMDETSSWLEPCQGRTPGLSFLWTLWFGSGLLTSFVGGVFEGLLILVLALMAWHFLGFPLLMAGMRRRARPLVPTKETPKVSVILPVYNEERNLASRVENLLAQDYPRDRLEIIIVESGSTDGTALVAQELAARVPNLKVLAQGSRLGKASAVGAGKTVADGSIIVVSDANTVYAPSTLSNLVKPFGDPRIGGVGGRFVPRHGGDPKAAGSDLYWSIEEIIRSGEAALDSCCTFHGEVYAWRRELVEPDSAAIIDDLDSAIQIRRKGYRIGYAPEALAYESVPLSVSDMAIQWKKNALGAIQCAFRSWRFLIGTPNFYTYLIFPSHKGLQVLQPFLLILGALAFVGAIVFGGLIDAALIVLVFLILFVGAAAVLFLEMRRAPTRGPGTFFHPLSLIRTFVAFQYAILLAWKDYILGKRDVRWEKVESTRV
jgi:cellulose synthase/poly-beta-1,6-N-acetylglucosamine synthase-like glycosyltransferase